LKAVVEALAKEGGEFRVLGLSIAQADGERKSEEGT
jgi:hypothetical protein